MFEVQLSRNLRKTILQGHPWVFQDAVHPVKESGFCKILDNRNNPLGWGLYSPNSALALRVLSLEKNTPNKDFFFKKFQNCLDLRKLIIKDDTNAYRLFNGEGDQLGGLICDVYNQVAVVQYDGELAKKFWREMNVISWLLNHFETIVEKPRNNEKEDVKIHGVQLSSSLIEITEHGIKFLVDVIHGQKTGFFLDQRENRLYLKSVVKGLSGINIFSYSGGFSLYAGAGEASNVISLDISNGALQLAQKSWNLNSFSAGHQLLCADAYQYLAENKELFDFIVVDPPTMTHSEKQKNLAAKKYIQLFSQAAKKLKPGGHLFLSSCSGHLDFEDFHEIVKEAISLARKRAQVLRISGQGPDHPFAHVCKEFRYLKFTHLIV